MGEIALLGLEFYGRHGVMPEEGRLGARFVVDLWLSVPFEGKGDRLEETVDYAAVYALVEEAVRHRRFYLIEAPGFFGTSTPKRKNPVFEGVSSPHLALMGRLW